jgi:hypothetical protein
LPFSAGQGRWHIGSTFGNGSTAGRW